MELEIILRVITGVLFALGGGHLFVEGFYRWLRGPSDLKGERKPKPVPPWLTGFVERSLFTLVVGLELGAAAPAMMTWIAAKMLANWSRARPTIQSGEERDAQIRGAFVALLSSAVSMMFALAGGLIAAGKIWPPPSMWSGAMDEIRSLLTVARIKLIVSFIGTILVASSVGRNPVDAHHDMDHGPVYLASVLHPNFFYGGMFALGLGFLIQLFG